jgi:ribosomal protein S18 acetylase RimI-like enzyme
MIRPAEPIDFDEWFRVFAAVVGEGRWMGREPPLARQEMRELFDGSLADPEALVLVADLDGALAGGLTAHGGGGRYELGMFVAADARGLGVGGGLLDECLRLSAARGAHKVILQVWPHNEAAVGLYRSRGFVEEGRLRRHYRRHNGELWDVVLMGRLLEGTG